MAFYKEEHSLLFSKEKDGIPEPRLFFLPKWPSLLSARKEKRSCRLLHSRKTGGTAYRAEKNCRRDGEKVIYFEVKRAGPQRPARRGRCVRAGKKKGRERLQPVIGKGEDGIEHHATEEGGKRRDYQKTTKNGKAARGAFRLWR